MTKLSIGFSPCPNDTFIFDALVHQRIDTQDIRFEPVLADVEELNQLAFRQELDITKLSYHALGHLRSSYALLHAGSALGNNCGPLLIAKRPLTTEEIEKGPIAIPGKYTTANFLLSLAYPGAQNKKEYLFSDIEQAVLDEEVIAGLIIHENRFTYQDKGLIKLLDCGEFWESAYHLPIPLGGICISRQLSPSLQWTVNRLLKESVQYAFDHPKEAAPFIRKHAQEMDETVMYQHINLYVNDYTLHLGDTGSQAVQNLFEVAEQKGILSPFEGNLFVQKPN
jgi:1,4-dihydroxy-6-naphthoate synthase